MQVVGKSHSLEGISATEAGGRGPHKSVRGMPIGVIKRRDHTVEVCTQQQQTVRGEIIIIIIRPGTATPQGDSPTQAWIKEARQMYSA